MKLNPTLLPSAILMFLVWQVGASAQIITTPNIFNNGTTQATVMTDSDYNTGSFPQSNIDDLSASGLFVFGDYARGGSTSNPTVNDQNMSISGFTDPTGIGSLRIFDGDNYEEGRVATQVTLYYTKLTLTGSALLDKSNYHVLNGGLAYNLPANPISNNGYTGGTDVASTINYDELTGLSVPAGTKSILLDFGPERDAYNGNTYFVGAAFAEIQAFGGAVGVPEPSTWAMTLGALAFLGFCVRRKGFLVK